LHSATTNGSSLWRVWHTEHALPKRQIGNEKSEKDKLERDKGIKDDAPYISIKEPKFGYCSDPDLVSEMMGWGWIIDPYKLEGSEVEDLGNRINEHRELKEWLG
jgi:hypothetical protein